LGEKGKTSWTCKICGQKIPRVYSFCTNCGAKRSEEGWICSNCSKNVPYDEYAYCIYCGAKKTISIKVKPALPPKAKPKPPKKPTVTQPPLTKVFPKGYTLIEKIGQGGFAYVYKAKDPEGRIVALKFPKIDLTETIDESCFKQFLKEARIWKKLKHPSIVKVYDCGSAPLPWISMEYMKGGSLRERLKKGRLSVKEALEIAIKIADAIQFAHHNGVVHQDINPKNILFTDNGYPKLTDWGLVKVLLETSSSTEVFEGTFICAAPEQLASEKFGKVDWRTDIYSFGVILYWMLTGKPPFVSKDILGYIKKVTEEKIRPVREIDPSIPPKLEAILQKILAKRKEDRYEAIALVKKDLKEVMSTLT
jgi:serine/threonine protein kinase